MEKKYKTEPEGSMLRIIALKDFSDVEAGDKGGLIEKEDNLSQEGDCWVSYYARVSGNACVYENAIVYGNAKIFDNAKVYGDALVDEQAKIYGNARVYGNASVFGNAKVYNNAYVFGNAWVWGKAEVCGDVKLWATKGFYNDNITTFIKDSKDYIILGTKGELRIFSSDIKNLIDKEISIVEENYIKNIQTIRQIYGKEV